jgi:sulfatase maturation enzyme AslB (radical SAM superfamily)
MNKPTLPFLETMITQSCNLSCHGCTNYSDLSHSGYVPWAQGQAQIGPWLEKLEIPDFGLIGGEPLINPELQQWILGVRTLLPRSQIRLTTNGLLLHKHPDLLPLLGEIGNCVFKITVHVDNVRLEDTIKKIFSSYQWEPVTEFGITRWRTNNNLRLQINRPDTFLKTYLNSYIDMAPHHSVPEQAFSACIQKNCPLLYQGKIYKCSTSALLLDTLNRFHRPNWDQWVPYLEEGIGPDSPDNLLQNFIENFGKHHAQCAQCPTSLVKPLNHLQTVKRK